MKKIVSSICIAAALALPIAQAAPAVAYESEPLVRTYPCPYGTYGVIIFVAGLPFGGCLRRP